MTDYTLLAAEKALREALQAPREGLDDGQRTAQVDVRLLDELIQRAKEKSDARKVEPA